MTTKQRIGLLTSGGDCSDLNAVLRAVVRRAVIGYDWDIIGIENGTLDLLQRPVGARPMTPADFNGTLMRQSGTFLVSTNTGNPFTFEMPDGSTCDRSSEVAVGMRELELDVILIPEISYELDVVAERLESAGERGHNFALMIVAEAVTSLDSGAETVGNAPGKTTYGGVGHALAAQLSEMVSAEIRVTVLGHVQRGGLPTARDRLVASVFGVRAVDLLADCQCGRMVAWRERQVIDVPIGGAIYAYHVVNIDGPVVATARGHGISLGDT